jgi:hypothetical protein
MRNQFVYTEEVLVPSKDELSSEKEKVIVRHSFNVDMINKIVQVDLEGGVIVFLDDIHERTQEKPFKNQNGKTTMRSVRDTYQSEIKLAKEDADRLFALTDITKTDNE